jgi:hypothetical protein
VRALAGVSQAGSYERTAWESASGPCDPTTLEKPRQTIEASSERRGQRSSYGFEVERPGSSSTEQPPFRKVDDPETLQIDFLEGTAKKRRSATEVLCNLIEPLLPVPHCDRAVDDRAS